MKTETDMLPDHYVGELKKEIEELQSMLEPLESGKLKTGERRCNGDQWVDTTQARIGHLKRSMATLQVIVLHHWRTIAQKDKGDP